MSKLVFTILAGLTLLSAATSDRVARLRRSDRGSVTVEQVIITAALVGVAGLVVAAIVAVVNSKVGQIQ